MTIKFYKNYSDKNVVSKNIKQIGSDITNAVIVDNVSVTDPVFRLKDFSGFNPATANYCYIDTLSRYYYITNIVILTPEIYEIHCHVDVLKTYASEIRGTTGLIARQQNNGSLYYQDGVMKTKAYSNYDIIQYPSGFTDFHYVLTVAGS